MHKVLEHINLIVGVFAVVVGGFIPVHDFVQTGSIDCSDALGLGIFAAGVILLCVTFFVARSNFNKKFFYFLAVLIVGYLIVGLSQYVIQWFYGMVGQFDKCTLFPG